MSDWIVYVLRCSDDSLYTGVTTDLKRRLEEHNSGSGAKYTRSRLPVSAEHVELGHDQSSALSREAEIKSMSKAKKEKLVNGQS
jgi:predicted GIY-YIG superfamily endonuclease